jgi:hypothetical protein
MCGNTEKNEKKNQEEVKGKKEEGRGAALGWWRCIGGPRLIARQRRHIR